MENIFYNPDSISEGYEIIYKLYLLKIYIGKILNLLFRRSILISPDHPYFPSDADQVDQAYSCK